MVNNIIDLRQKEIKEREEEEKTYENTEIICEKI